MTALELRHHERRCRTAAAADRRARRPRRAASDRSARRRSRTALRGRVVVALGLDALHLGEQPADAVAEGLRRRSSRSRSCRRASAPRSPSCSPSASGRSSGGCACGLLRSACPRGRAAAAPARCACSSRTRRARSRRDPRPATRPSSTSLRIGQEVQRDEIGARLLERRELLLERGLRVAVQPLGDLARAVADHLVHVRRQLAGEARSTSSARAASSGVHENSLRNSGSVDLSYASLTFDSDTDLLP